MKLSHPFISNKRQSRDLFLMMPALATFLLEHYNKINVRPLDFAEACKRIARAIVKGEWNPDTGNRLRFEKNTGYIIDGQTRLQAIVEAGQPVLVDVIWGIDNEAGAFSDRQRRRSLGAAFNAMSKQGCSGTPKLNRAGAVARVWLRFVNHWKEMRFTDYELFKFYQQHENSIEAMLEKREFKPANRAGFRAACAFYHSINARKAMTFFDAVTSDGSGLKSNSPALILRNYLVSINSSSQHAQKQLFTDFTATLGMLWALHNNQSVTAITHKLEWP